jgi:hypothetical protein
MTLETPSYPAASLLVKKMEAAHRTGTAGVFRGGSLPSPDVRQEADCTPGIGHPLHSRATNPGYIGTTPTLNNEALLWWQMGIWGINLASWPIRHRDSRALTV